MNTLFGFDKITRIRGEEDEYYWYRRILHNGEDDRVKYKSYEEYFGEMDISEERIAKRVAIAEDLRDVMVAFFIFYEMQRELGIGSDDYKYDYLSGKYKEVIYKHLDIDLEVHSEYIDTFVEERTDSIIDATDRHIDDDDEWWTSDGRAWMIGADDGEGIESFEEFAEAMDSGKRFKTWNDMKDNKERKSHKTVGGKTIPITDLFVVGNSYMLFPKDLSHDASPEEYINCRCWATYS